MKGAMAASQYDLGQKLDGIHDLANLCGTDIQSEEILRTMEGEYRSANGEFHQSTVYCTAILALCYLLHKRHTTAEPLIGALFSGLLHTHGETHRDTLIAYHLRVILENMRGRSGEAESLLLSALQACRDAFGTSHDTTLQIMMFLGRTYVVQKRFEKAVEMLASTIELIEVTDDASRLCSLQCRMPLAAAYYCQGQPALAEATLAAAVQYYGNDEKADYRRVERCRIFLTQLRVAQQKSASGSGQPVH